LTWETGTLRLIDIGHFYGTTQEQDVIFEQGQRIVMIGDSITDAGRREEAYAPFGRGYAALVQAFVTARYPERGLNFENRGIGGDTVRHLKARWDEDAIALRPDWLSVKIGINDVWRAYGAKAHEAVPADEYESTLRELLQCAVDETGCRLIVMEPYVIEKNPDDPQLVQTRHYAEIARGIAAEFDAVNVRTQDAFDRVLEHSESTDWAHDRIHPNLAGHAVIAQAFLKAIGFGM
jgi:lysophospholipase L1-like esterase